MIRASPLPGAGSQPAANPLPAPSQSIFQKNIPLFQNTYLGAGSTAFRGRPQQDVLFNHENNLVMRIANPPLRFVQFWMSCIFAISLIFLLASCKRTDDYVEAQAIPPSIATYVHGFTSGIIDPTDPVRVKFTGAVVAEDRVGQEADGILQFLPKTKGQAWWEDASTLRFDPEPGWRPGKNYLATVKLDEVFENLPDEARRFEFNFLVSQLKFAADVFGLEIPQGSQLAALSGRLQYSSSILDQEGKVEQTVQAQFNGKPLPVSFYNESPGLTRFVVQDIPLGERPGKLLVKWSGKPLGVEVEDRAEIEIPRIDEFRVLDVKRLDPANKTMTVYFSRPLDPAQNLAGLIAFDVNDFEPVRDDIRTDIQDNRLVVYPPEWIDGDLVLWLYPGIRSAEGLVLENATTWQVRIPSPKPKVRLAGTGHIIPAGDQGILLPFEAIGLEAVEVEIFKIFDDNVLQFLQESNLDESDSYELNRVGRVVSQQMVPLTDLKPNADPTTWNRYALDLSKLFKADPHAIYQVRIGFRPEYARYPCRQNKMLANLKERTTQPGEIKSLWDDYYGIEGYYEGFEWSHFENPCFPAYYNRSNFAAVNVFSTHIGLTAKAGNPDASGRRTFFIAAADLRSTEALANVQLEFYDYQKQLITTAKTASDGTASITLSGNPFFVVARHGDASSFLRLGDGNALNLSRFDVSGTTVQQGLKGFIYGERGVWRPGDSLYLAFILDDPSRSLPKNHPVRFDLYDARGQVRQTGLASTAAQNIYPIHLATSPDAPTGIWRLVVQVGSATFEKRLRIETVKPNRLRINLQFANGAPELSASQEPVPATMQVNWLHGAPGANLRTTVEVTLQRDNSGFSALPDFRFDDPTRGLFSEPKVIFDGKTDNSGKASFQTHLYDPDSQAPGKLLARFTARAFEPGGDFSFYNTRLTYHPFSYYAGVRIPLNRYGEKRIDLGKPGEIKVASVDTRGRPRAGRQLSVSLYRVEWSWWWESDDTDLAEFNSGTHYNALQTKTLTTGNDGTASWQVHVNDWGRYLVRVCDTETGHCAGDFFYAGYPWDDESANVLNRQNASMMIFKTTKAKYKVGEEIEVVVPAGEKSKVLITLEKGDRILRSEWKDAKPGKNTFRFKASPEMVPTVYVHASLIQPHGQVHNDLPVRMYGVLGVDVEDPRTVLEPQLGMPEELKPEQNFTLEVSEKNGRPMAYTIAIVDEGLLGLTNFQTPNPHAAIYAREALDVHTWDLYDYVLGAFDGKQNRILSVGGDEDLSAPLERKNANRFKPVVLYAGPFQLDKGKKRHTFTMPNYVGSVRVMVVAANAAGAYGQTERSVPVRKPLMVLATLPRVLAPGERLRMPVTVFAMHDKVRNVSVSLTETTGLVSIENGKQKSLGFTRPGEQTTGFDLVVNDGVGIAKFRVEATGGSETATEIIEIDVRNPNPPLTEVYSAMVSPGQSWRQTFEPLGMRGTNKAVLEASVMPPIDLDRHLQYLIHYPHGCLEQTVSAAFPQLYVDKLTKIDPDRQASIQQNVTAAIEKLKNFQSSSGGFSFWPGQSEDEWATNYAGHFLLEAHSKGYGVPSSLIDRFVRFQQNKARLWTPAQPAGARPSYATLTQAYRLYTLALAGKPDAAAMNRLRELPNLPADAAWRLAAAYALAGKKETGRELVANKDWQMEHYRELTFTWGSDLRDEAMILETQLLLDKQEQAALNARQLAEQLSQDHFMSTQTSAWTLMALARYAEKYPPAESFSFAWTFGTGARGNAGSNLPVLQLEVPVDRGSNRSVGLTNTGKAPIFVRLILHGQPHVGASMAEASRDIGISVAYFTTNGIPLDVSNLPQGYDFIASVLVHHPGSRSVPFNELALEQLFPSGWEIVNSRLYEQAEFLDSSTPENQDVRDDRVYTYFDLNRYERKIFRVRLTAAYEGRFYLPPVRCSAMYDETIYALQPGGWVTVRPANTVQ